MSPYQTRGSGYDAISSGYILCDDGTSSDSGVIPYRNRTNYRRSSAELNIIPNGRKAIVIVALVANGHALT